jgi:uncharacterized protein
MGLQRRAIFIDQSPLGGRGVFAAEPIKEGEMIEICPVLVMNSGDMALLDKTYLYDYYFLWGESGEDCAVALGFGSLYNHFCPSNADYDMDFDNKNIEIIAVRDIAMGDEITINYHGDPIDPSPTWFMLENR